MPSLPTRPTAHTLALLLGLSLLLTPLACDDGGGGDEGDDTASGMDTAGDAGGDTSSPTDTGGTDTGMGSDTSTTDTNEPEDMGPPVCTDGTVECRPSGNVETCSAGQWSVTEDCAAGCKNAACAMAGDTGACDDPIVIGVGQTVQSTTDTVYNPNTWSQECTSAYGQQTGTFASTTGPETVFQLTVTRPSVLTLSLDALDPTFFGLYIRSDCTNPASEVSGKCTGSPAPGGSAEVSGLFGPGTYFVFVDDFGTDGNGTGEFTLSVQEELIPQCAGQIPRLLDLSEPITVEGHTNTGMTSEDWLGPECPVVQSTNGAENIYQFALPRELQVEVAVTPTDPADSRVGVYIRPECEARYDQVACGYTAGGGTAFISETLPAGEYFLFVDDFSPSIDEPQAYRMEVSAQ